MVVLLCLHMAQLSFNSHQNTQPYLSWWRWGHVGSIILTLPTVMAGLVWSCAVWGELRLGSCSPAVGRRRYKLWKREITVSHCPRAGRAMPLSLSRRSSWPLLSIRLPRGCVPTSLAYAATSTPCTAPAAQARQGQGKCW